MPSNKSWVPESNSIAAMSELQPVGVLMEHVFEHDFDDGEKPERAGDHPRQGHQAERQDRDVDQHADPKPHEFAKVVAAASLGALDMTHARGADVLGDLENEAVDVRVRRAGFRDLVDHETAEATKAAQVKFFRLLHHEVGDEIGELAAGIAPPGMFFPVVNAEDNVAVFRFGNGEELERFRGRVLQVVIQGDGVSPRDRAQPRQDGVVFAEIARQAQERHRDLAFPSEFQRDGFSLIAAAVVHDDQLVAAFDLERGNFLVKRGQGRRCVVERDDDAEMRRGISHVFFGRRQRRKCQRATIGDGWRRVQAPRLPGAWYLPGRGAGGNRSAPLPGRGPGASGHQ